MKNAYFLSLGLITLGLPFTISNPQVIPTTENQQINATLTEAASPSIPLVSTTPSEKSKLQLYQGIMPLIATVNVTPETAQRAIDKFFVDVVDVALATLNVTKDQLSEVKTTVKAAEDALVFQSNSLKTQTGPQAATLQKGIGETLAALLTKQRALSSKIKAQDDFLNLLAQANKIPPTQLAAKVSSYQHILVQVTPNIVQSSRQEFFDELSRLVTQSKNTPQENSVKSLLDRATISLPGQKAFFESLKLTFVQQDQPIAPTAAPFALPTPITTGLAPAILPSTPQFGTPMPTTSAPSITSPTPRGPLQPTTLAATPKPPTPAPSLALAQADLPPAPSELPPPPAPPVVKSAKKPAKSKPKTQPVLPDKQPLDKKAALAAGKDIAKGIAKVALKPPTQPVPSKPLTPEQQEQAALLALEKELPAVKVALETSTDFMQVITTCTKAIRLLTTNIKSSEKTNLKHLLAQRIPQLYNERANRPEQEIVALNNLFQTASKNKEATALVSKNQLETTNALVQITTATNQQKTPQKIARFSLAVQALTPNLDRYEKQLFMDGITTAFNTRKNFTKSELEQLQQIFMELSSKPLRKRKIFDATTYQQFENWGRIVQCRLILIAPTPQKTFSDLVRLYQSTLLYISLPDAIHEREIFTSNTLPALFAHRGNVKLNDIQVLHTFFSKTVATQNILAANQVPVVMFWVQELTNAQLLTTQDKTYAEALIDQAVATRAIALYGTALTLFTQHTSANVRRAFIIALNTLFSQRTMPPAVDRRQLSHLLEEVGRKKLTPATPFLSPNQKTKLREWQATLASEIRVAQ